MSEFQCIVKGTKIWFIFLKWKGALLFALKLMAWCKHSLLITILWTGDSIDSSKLSLKAFPLHNGNTLPSIPVGHSVHNKESYENMKILMEDINYDILKWQICSDLKVTALLLGLKQGFTKYCCFICEWDSRAQSLHYSRQYWSARKSLEPGIMNVENQPLV